MADPIHACRRYDKLTVVSVFPDVCLTPCGNSLIPIPYTILAKGEDLRDTVTSVSFTSMSAANLKSVFPRCYGDSEGTGGGLVSGTTGGVCEFGEHRTDVLINGEPAVAESHWTFMNNGNTIGLNRDPTLKPLAEVLNSLGDAADVASKVFDRMAEITEKNLLSQSIPRSPGLEPQYLQLSNIGRMLGYVAPIWTLGSVMSQPTDLEILEAAAKELVKAVAVVVMLKVGADAIVVALVVVAAGVAADALTSSTATHESAAASTAASPDSPPQAHTAGTAADEGLVAGSENWLTTAEDKLTKRW